MYTYALLPVNPFTCGRTHTGAFRAFSSFVVVLFVAVFSLVYVGKITNYSILSYFCIAHVVLLLVSCLTVGWCSVSAFSDSTFIFGIKNMQRL